MKSVSATRIVNAPIAKVFDAISNANNFMHAVSDIKSVEFVTDQQTGVGTRFKETREMNGKANTVELEFTEWVENQHVRLISDEGGTIWDSVFTVEQKTDGVELKLVMDAKPYKLVAKLITPMIFGMVAKAVQGDMDAIKAFCER